MCGRKLFLTPCILFFSYIAGPGGGGWHAMQDDAVFYQPIHVSAAPLLPLYTHCQCQLEWTAALTQ